MKKITTEELKDLFDKRAHFLLINVDSSSAHKKEHIFGSLNIPLEELKKKAPFMLGRDEFIIVYCEGALSSRSAKAAALLEELGFKRVSNYEGGVADWKKHGHDIIRKIVLKRRAA